MESNYSKLNEIEWGGRRKVNEERERERHKIYIQIIECGSIFSIRMEFTMQILEGSKFEMHNKHTLDPIFMA